mmetsp:Transcript_7645/g.13882  ORF Transcript_7645/g.13882 Transcript_7645/m.13882 type:complete len:93 (-) Transcript_7645:201-479(-)
MCSLFPNNTERMFVYNVVVRDNNNSNNIKDVEMMEKSSWPDQHQQYQLTDNAGNVTSPETTPSSSPRDERQDPARTSTDTTVPKSLDIPPMA